VQFPGSPPLSDPVGVLLPPATTGLLPVPPVGLDGELPVPPVVGVEFPPEATPLPELPGLDGFDDEPLLPVVGTEPELFPAEVPVVGTLPLSDPEGVEPPPLATTGLLPLPVDEPTGEVPPAGLLPDVGLVVELPPLATVVPELFPPLLVEELPLVGTEPVSLPPGFPDVGIFPLSEPDGVELPPLATVGLFPLPEEGFEVEVPPVTGVVGLLGVDGEVLLPPLATGLPAVVPPSPLETVPEVGTEPVSLPAGLPLVGIFPLSPEELVPDEDVPVEATGLVLLPAAGVVTAPPDVGVVVPEEEVLPLLPPLATVPPEVPPLLLPAVIPEAGTEPVSLPEGLPVEGIFPVSPAALPPEVEEPADATELGPLVVDEPLEFPVPEATGVLPTLVPEPEPELDPPAVEPAVPPAITPEPAPLAMLPVSEPEPVVGAGILPVSPEELEPAPAPAAAPVAPAEPVATTVDDELPEVGVVLLPELTGLDTVPVLPDVVVVVDPEFAVLLLPGAAMLPVSVPVGLVVGGAIYPLSPAVVATSIPGAFSPVKNELCASTACSSVCELSEAAGFF
jgi:hypothetical protein